MYSAHMDSIPQSLVKVAGNCWNFHKKNDNTVIIFSLSAKLWLRFITINRAKVPAALARFIRKFRNFTKFRDFLLSTINHLFTQQLHLVTIHSLITGMPSYGMWRLISCFNPPLIFQRSGTRGWISERSSGASGRWTAGSDIQPL